MKTTLEIPDKLFRKAKVKAAEQGIPLRQFVAHGIEREIETAEKWKEKPWMEMAGKLKHLKKENARIRQLIEEEFRVIEPEMWK